MDPETYWLGLTGWPLTYSLSPAIQNAALSALHLPGEYCLHPVPPYPAGREAMLDLLERLRSGELTGLNVTIPHKQAVLACLDDLTSIAQAVGAVNTLFRRGGRLVGDNTDVTGFLADLRRVAPSLPLDRKQAGLKPAHALILGAGGAARAAVCALAGLGWQVTIAARRIEQAEKLVEDLSRADAASSIPSGLYPTLLDPDRMLDRKTRLDLVVNATPAGMVSHEHESAWPDELPLPREAFIYDMVYVPRETSLLRRARSEGNPSANGAGMLVEQAAAAFEIWTGRTAPRGVMQRAFSNSASTQKKDTK
jgi:shikimate dehydrogenase